MGFNVQIHDIAMLQKMFFYKLCISDNMISV